MKILINEIYKSRCEYNIIGKDFLVIRFNKDVF